MKKDKKLIIIASVILVAIAALIFTTFFAYTKVTTGTADVTVLPEDATYKIDGKDYTGNQKITLKEGSYDATFNRQYFSPKTVQIKVKKLQTTGYDIVLEVAPGVDEKTIGIYDQNILQSVADKTYDKNVNKAVDENPLIKKLPYITDNFRIDYGFSPTNKSKAIYEITLYPGRSGQSEEALRKAATDWIKSQGYDIASLEVKWTIE